MKKGALKNFIEASFWQKFQHVRESGLKKKGRKIVTTATYYGKKGSPPTNLFSLKYKETYKYAVYLGKRSKMVFKIKRSIIL